MGRVLLERTTEVVRLGHSFPPCWSLSRPTVVEWCLLRVHRVGAVVRALLVLRVLLVGSRGMLHVSCVLAIVVIVFIVLLFVLLGMVPLVTLRLLVGRFLVVVLFGRFRALLWLAWLVLGILLLPRLSLVGRLLGLASVLPVLVVSQIFLVVLLLPAVLRVLRRKMVRVGHA